VPQGASPTNICFNILPKEIEAFPPLVLNPLSFWIYFTRVSMVLVRADHTNETPFTANGSTAKNATRCRGFFQQKQPVTGQEFLFILFLLLNLELE
jgi:hypothetical protein